ncbi:UDP-N-acetylmuramoyl-L-alanine--D-glutamate ligase [Sneathiella sp.]|jgi:UDP-N-acetylmuramoylalanine--D-glutamate ligase|uniref:UDP-N-acetylmuramoyl-L-alanine--D-glutamate ligase n=1 Tax=Sneathiella sp. TaxID=1964365 RepID=UPI0039E66741
MMKSHAFENKEIAVFGLGKSGFATALRLQEGQARVFVWDDNEGRRSAAQEMGLSVQDFGGTETSSVDALVLSPGVPLTHPEPHPVVKKAQQNHIPIVGDVEIFMQEKDAGRVVGITGTNGKSTTTALIHHILAVNNCETAMGGNIGTPVMDLPQLGQDGVYVLELSSYQLDLTPSWQADIAVILNVTPDHLDRHGDIQHYASVKQRIFQNQTSEGVAVINSDDPFCQSMAEDILKNGAQRVLPISTKRPLQTGIYVLNGILTDKTERGMGWSINISNVDSLRGVHNWQNAAAAVGVVRSLGLDSEQIEKGLRSFGGLVHRMEQIDKRGKIRFVNDSKATNAEAAEKALSSFENIFWICGGRAKSGGIESLSPYFSRIQKAYLIGECADQFETTLAGHVKLQKCKELETAFQSALADAKAFDEECVILLSPATASFDQFPSFEARGDAFRSLVEGERS